MHRLQDGPKMVLLFVLIFLLLILLGGVIPALVHAAPTCTPAAGKAKVAAQVRSACIEDGLSAKCADSLVHLDWHESGLTPTLIYRSYRGVGQMNRNIAVKGNWRNAHDFTHRQIKYIRARYGCPCRALAHKHRTARRTRLGYIGGWY
jgi:hypothetical protein